MLQKHEGGQVWLQHSIRRLALTLILLLLTGAGVVAASGSSIQSRRLLAISGPATPVLPDDLPLGLVYNLQPDLAAASTVFDTANAVGGPLALEYLRFNQKGDAYLTFDRTVGEEVTGGVLVIDDLADRDNGSFDASRDRLISGSATGLLKPKSLAIVDALGFVIVADFGAANIKVFGVQAEGDTPPLFVTDMLGETDEGDPRAPWGVAFDDLNNRLFVATTDGTLLVYDHYLINRGRGGPDRLIVPTAEGKKASANLHDLVYLAAHDALIASDVGAAITSDEPGFDTDGKLLVIEQVATAEGETEVMLQVSGSDTLLGNPVGLAFDGTDLFVAEKSKDVVLRFDNLLMQEGVVELAPNGAVTVPQPESVTLR